jgi:hypothetical protein
MDRTGNSLDRALLLADLLAAAGLDVRLARTRLPQDVAIKVSGRELARPRVEQAETLFANEDDVAWYRASVASNAAELADMLGLPANGQGPTLSELAAGSIADHWWVQAVSGAGWADFDPLFGEDACARPAAETVIEPADLPVDLRHSVTVRLVIERADGDGLTESVPLEHTITLGSGEPLGSLDLSFDYALGSEAGTDEVTEVVELARVAAFWRPVLDLGPEIVRATGSLSRAGSRRLPRPPPPTRSRRGCSRWMPLTHPMARCSQTMRNCLPHGSNTSWTVPGARRGSRAERSSTSLGRCAKRAEATTPCWPSLRMT